MSNFFSQQLPSERENGEKKDTAISDSSALFLKVESGLKFMLSHFSEPLFPRTISRTVINRRQYEVEDKETAMCYYQAALWEDCRIAAFGVNQTNPDLIFIDLDACDFGNMKALKAALTITLKNIQKKLGGHPTVCWSGRGYHIIQPIDCQVDLRQVPEFAALTDDPNTDFIRFAECYLSDNKQDKSHYPSMRSCLLRVPHTFNSKCKELDIDAEVKIIRRWDGYRPDHKLLIGGFYADLVGKQTQRKNEGASSILTNGVDYGPISWIEKLLQTPIEDFRKRTRDLILVPYLVVRRGMIDVDQIQYIVMQWADNCAKLYRLEPSRREYASRVRSRTYEVMRSNPKIPPMRLETLKEKNPGLFKKLEERSL
jgi:hypothetical protein